MICGLTSARSARTSAITSPPKSDMTFLRRRTKTEAFSGQVFRRLLRRDGVRGPKGPGGPLLEDLQREVQQLSLALLPPLDHLQDGDGSAQIPAELQHLLVGRLVVLTVLNTETGIF